MTISDTVKRHAPWEELREGDLIQGELDIMSHPFLTTEMCEGFYTILEKQVYWSDGVSSELKLLHNKSQKTLTVEYWRFKTLIIVERAK